MTNTTTRSAVLLRKGDRIGQGRNVSDVTNAGRLTTIHFDTGRTFTVLAGQPIPTEVAR